MENNFSNIFFKPLMVREFNAIKEPVLISINDKHDIIQLPDVCDKDDAIFKELRMFMIEKGWNAVLYNCTLKITEINMKETVRLIPFIGESTDYEIINIKFELTPEHNIIEFV